MIYRWSMHPVVSVYINDEDKRMTFIQVLKIGTKQVLVVRVNTRKVHEHYW